MSPALHRLALALLAVGAALVGSACEVRPARGFLAADRRSGELLRLDSELVLRARIEAPGVRHLSSAGPRPWFAAGDELLRLDERWNVVSVPASTHLGQCVALAGGSGGEAYVLARSAPGAETLWRVESDGACQMLGGHPGAVALALSRAAFLLGFGDGRLVELGRAGGVRAVSWTRAPVAALAQGPEEGSWWTLAGEGPALLELRGPGLELRHGLVIEQGPGSFAPVGERERVWVAAGPRLRRHGEAGRLEAELELPQGAWRAAWATDDRAWLLSAGALLEVRSSQGSATIVRTQGGFGELVALGPEASAEGRTASRAERAR